MYVAVAGYEVGIVSVFLFLLFMSLAFLTSEALSPYKFAAVGPSPLPPTEVYHPPSIRYAVEEEPELILTPSLFKVMELCPGGCIYYRDCIPEGQCVPEGYICHNGRLVESCGNSICESECETPESCPEDCGFEITLFSYKLDENNIDKYYLGWTSDHYKYPDIDRSARKERVYLYALADGDYELTTPYRIDREPVTSILDEDGGIKEKATMILKIDSTNCMVAVRNKIRDDGLRDKGEIKKYYNKMKMLVVETPWYLVDDVSELACVREVYPNNMVYAELDAATRISGAKDAWERIDIEEYCWESEIGLGATTEHCIPIGATISRTTGEGINIALVDSGIDHLHHDFDGKIEEEINIISPEDPADDDIGHGTHCSSIALGTGAESSGNKYSGVAPASELWAIKVLNEDGYGTLSDIVDGIKYAADPNGDDDCSDHADIISISIGCFMGSDGTTPDSVAAQYAADCGAIVISSAGNAGALGHNTITSPADVDDIIAVGAIDKERKMYERSSLGPVDDRLLKPDLVAPGVNIIAARAYDSTYWFEGEVGMREVYETVYTTATGTSMAAPHVAGASALLMGERDDLTPRQIKSILMISATPLGNSVFEEGAGALNVMKALYTPIAVYPPSAFFDDAENGDSEDFEIHNIGEDRLRVETRPITIFDEDGNRIGEASTDRSYFYLNSGDSEEIELTLTNVSSSETYQYGRLLLIVTNMEDDDEFGTPYRVPFGIKT